MTRIVKRWKCYTNLFLDDRFGASTSSTSSSGMISSRKSKSSFRDSSFLYSSSFRPSSCAAYFLHIALSNRSNALLAVVSRSGRRCRQGWSDVRECLRGWDTSGRTDRTLLTSNFKVRTLSSSTSSGRESRPKIWHRAFLSSSAHDRVSAQPDTRKLVM